LPRPELVERHQLDCGSCKVLIGTQQYKTGEQPDKNEDQHQFGVGLRLLEKSSRVLLIATAGLRRVDRDPVFEVAGKALDAAISDRRNARIE
jgi:hypothetical protein